MDKIDNLILSRFSFLLEEHGFVVKLNEQIGRKYFLLFVSEQFRVRFSEYFSEIECEIGNPIEDTDEATSSLYGGDWYHLEFLYYFFHHLLSPNASNKLAARASKDDYQYLDFRASLLKKELENIVDFFDEKDYKQNRLDYLHFRKMRDAEFARDIHRNYS